MGFTPIDESEIASTGPSYSGFKPISEDEIAPAVSAAPEESSGSWWDTLKSASATVNKWNPFSVGPGISDDERLGLLKGIARAGSDVLAAPADLLYRAGMAGVNYATGNETDLTGTYPSDYRNAALDYISGGQGDKDVESTTQLLGNLGTIVAAPTQAQNIASKIPILSKVASGEGAISTIANLLAKTIGYGTEGAAVTALMDPKSETLGKDMAQGAALNVAIPAAFGGIEKLATSKGQKLANAADETLERGLGVQYGDRTKGLNRVNLYVDDAGDLVPLDKLDDAIGIQAPIQQQVKSLREAGIFEGAPNDVQGLKIHLAKKEAEIGKTIPRLVNQADKVIGGKEILPEFVATDRLLQGYRPETRKDLLKQFNAIVDDYIDSPGTGLKKLTKFTDQLQKETNFESAIPATTTKLKRAIQHDFIKAAEREFDQALPEMKGAFSQANNLFSASKAIGKTLNKPLARKMPELADYITGGSLPMTVTTGLLSAPLGFTPAATISGARLMKNAVQQYAEAAKPISTSALYRSFGEKISNIAKVGDLNDGNALGKLLTAIVGSKDPAGDQTLGALGASQSSLVSQDIPQGQQKSNKPPKPAASLSPNEKSQNPSLQPTATPNAIQQLLSKIIPEANAMDDMKAPQVEEITDFGTKVDKIAANLDAKPEHLLAVMNFETGGTLSPSIKNKAGSGATGLIQFMPATAQELTGADTKEAAIRLLASMSPVEQLDYVEKHLAPFKGKLKTLEDVYMAVLYPRAVGKDNDYALFKEGTKAYWQNRGLDLDGDGTVTKAEATAKVRNYNNKVTKV